MFEKFKGFELFEGFENCLKCFGLKTIKTS